MDRLPGGHEVKVRLGCSVQLPPHGQFVLSSMAVAGSSTCTSMAEVDICQMRAFCNTAIVTTMHT